MFPRVSRCWGLVTGAVVGMAAVSASAQFQPRHYDDAPGHYDNYGGRYDRHATPNFGRPGPSRVFPAGSSISHPRTTDFDRTGHSHEHVTGRRTTRRITYGGFSHIDDLAITLERQANALCLELHYNYQHNPGYSQTYREAYEILTTAKYIHGLEHSGNRAKIRAAVRELDALFHHVEDDVAHWTAHHHRRIGHGGLTTKLEDVEQTLHHLMDDIGARRPSSGRPETAPPATGGPPTTSGPPLVIED